MEHDELEFLQQIALYPTDHVAKGVFADFLDEKEKPELAQWMRKYPESVVLWRREEIGEHEKTEPWAVGKNDDNKGFLELIPLTYILAVCGVPPGSVDTVQRVWPYDTAPECLKWLITSDTGNVSFFALEYVPPPKEYRPSVLGLIDLGHHTVFHIGSEWWVTSMNY